MSNALPIDGRDFERWADRPEARSELPILVRRLLWASTRMQELDMPGGSGVDRPGYDGFCRSDEGSAFCPMGGSVWELSVNERVTGKIAADLAKRGEALPPQAERLSFVFVTPRRVAVNAMERHAPPAPWRSVRVIDADGLAQWIEQCPAVAAWFSRRHLQRPVDDVTTLDTYLGRWSAATRPPLPPPLVLLGRSSQVTQVHAWLAERPSALTVQATTKDEARVFLAAAVEALPAALREQWSARTIFVETPAAWRWLLQTSTMPLLLIPGFDDVDPRLTHGPHFVGLPGDRENPQPAWSQLALDEPLPWRDVEKMLREAGLEPWRAERIAQETRGQLRPLQRSLGLRELPRWAAREAHGELVTMLVLGAWRPDVEADAGAVRALGADPVALDRLCTRLRTATEAPIRSHEGVYSWATPDDAWPSLVGLVSEAVLRSFRALAVDVLGEDDPRDHVPEPEDDPPVAALWGAGFRHSGALRRGVAESLRYLARHNDELRKYIGASIGLNLAERVVEQVLTSSWRRWAALEPHLRSLAEAAPNRFLAQLTDSLNDPEGVVRLFDMETESPLYRRSPHVSLLWALEALAWNPANMPMVAEILAVLTDRDPARSEPRQHGRVSNRPQASLEAIFHISNPQTLADDEARFAVLKTLSERQPDVAFALLLRLYKQRAGGRVPQSRRPSDGESLAVSQLQTPTLAQVNNRCVRILELLLDLADLDAARWALVITADIERLMNESHAEEVLTRLLARKDGFGDTGVVVWRAARDKLGYLCGIDNGAMFEMRIARLRRIYEAFTPTDLLTRVSWLFEWGEVLPEPHSITLDDKTRRLDAMRVAVVEEILTRDEADDLMVQLIARLEEPDKLGRALSKCSAVASLQERLLQQTPPEAWKPLIASFASGCFYTAKQDFAWLRALVLRWREENRSDDIVGTLHKIWAEPRVWDIADELGESLRTLYWAGLKLVGEHEEHQWERACRHLLAAENFSTAFEMAAYRCEDLDTATLVEVLERFFANPNTASGDPAYGTEKIFLEFDRRDEQGIDDETRRRIVAMEFRLIQILEHGYQRRPRFVWQVLSESPTFFMGCLQAIYYGDDEPRPAVDETRARFAANADSILNAWHDFPGSDSDDPQIWEPQLLGWAEQVFALARELQRFVPAQFRVAEVLARPQAGEDGHWPCLAARELLQRGESPELLRALRTAKYNLRGLTTHGLHEGGVQERALATQFQASADALRTRWPQVGMLLDELARVYEEEGERQDQWARQQRAEAGIGPEDPPHLRPEEPAADELTPGRTSGQLTRLEIHAVGPAHGAELVLASRMNLLVGDNSLGKTFILDVMWWAATDTWPGPRRIAWPSTGATDAFIRVHAGGSVHSAGFDPGRQEWIRGPAWPNIGCPVIYARVDAGLSVFDPLLHDARLPAYHFSASTLWDGLPGADGKSLCNGLIADWLHWSLREDRAAFDTLLRTFRALMPDDPDDNVRPGPARQRDKHDAREIPTLIHPYGEVYIDHISAGMKRVLGFSYLLVWTWLNHREQARLQGKTAGRELVVLIDEVEMHLHPRWQRRLLPALLGAVQGLVDAPCLQIFGSTHSPMVLASIEPLFDRGQDKVYHLHLDEERRVVVDEVSWAKFGDASSWLESELFGLDRATSKEAERALDAAAALMRGEEAALPAELRTQEQINAQLRRTLAESHPFWLRWKLFVDEAGGR